VSSDERQPAFSRSFYAYVALLGIAVACFIPLGLGQFLRDPAESLLWVLLIGGASLLTVPILPKVDVDAGLGAPISVAAAVVLPPPLTLLVNFIGSTNEREVKRATSPWLSLFNRSQIALCAGLASVASVVVKSAFETTVVAEVMGTAAAVLVYNFANVVFISILLWVRGRLTLGTAARENVAPFPRFGVDFLLVGFLSVFIVISYERVGPFSVLLLAVPLGLGYSAMRSARESEDRALELAEQVRELEILNSLGQRLLSVQDLAQVKRVTEQALRTALGSDHVVFAIDGRGHAEGQRVAVPGSEPACIVVPEGVGGASLAVVEAVAGLLGVTLQRVELSEELGEMQRARVALSGQILEEGTRERSRIALEIHDEVLPYLAAAEIQADNVRSALFADEGQRAGKLALASREAIHGGISRLRDVLAALRSQIIVPGSLLRGLREALDELKLVHGVEGELEAPDELPLLPLAVEILVLETVRGCLTNVARHAKAERVTISVAVTETLISTTVCDDGVGFDPAAVSEGHHGIDLMTQRVQLARGRFLVDSRPGHGARVQIDVPL